MHVIVDAMWHYIPDRFYYQIVLLYSIIFINCISSKTFFLQNYTCACLHIIILFFYLMLIVELFQKMTNIKCMAPAKMG